MTKVVFAVADIVENSDEITLYDRQHFLTYARLLDAEAGGADWRELARGILLIDPDREPARARRCAENHLARARWIATTGVRTVIQQAENAQKLT